MKNDDLFTKNNTELDKVYNFLIGGEIISDNGFGIGVIGGYRIDNQKKKRDLLNSYRLVEHSIYTILMESSYYYDLSDNFKSYMSLGAGIARINIDFNHSRPPRRDENAIDVFKFAYSCSIGGLFVVSERITLGVDIQYFSALSLKREDLDPKYIDNIDEGGRIRVWETSIVSFLKVLFSLCYKSYILGLNTRYFLRVGFLFLIALNFSAHSSERLIGSNVEIGTEKILSVKENDDLFRRKNTKFGNGIWSRRVIFSNA